MLRLSRILNFNFSSRLSQAEIDALPTIKFNTKLEPLPSVLLMEKCPICLTEFLDQEVINKLHCTHLFHRQCISTWLCVSFSPKSIERQFFFFKGKRFVSDMSSKSEPTEYLTDESQPKRKTSNPVKNNKITPLEKDFSLFSFLLYKVRDIHLFSYVDHLVECSYLHYSCLCAFVAIESST